MEYVNLVKKSYNAFASNIIEYVLASLTVILGSIFIITAPPLTYGFAHMIIKGAKNENVVFDDVFEGFRSGNFKRSWEYGLLAIAVMVVAFVIWSILSLILNLALLFDSAFMSDYIMPVLRFILSFVLSIPSLFLQLVLFLFVIKRNEISEALSGGISLFKENVATSVGIFVIIVGLGLVESLPLIVGEFLQWHLLLSLTIIAVVHLLMVPFTSQIVANATLDLIAGEKMDSDLNGSNALQA